MGDPTEILGLTSDELRREAAARLPSGAGVAGAIYRQAMRHGRFAPEELGLPDRSVMAWRQHFCLSLPEIVRTQAEPAACSESGHRGQTIKWVMRTADAGLEFESVRIPMGDRRASLCVSSQVGCGRACRFCETARMGFLANLTAAEIVGQVVSARCRGDAMPVPDSVVFMGMGEALDNVEALIQALPVLNDTAGLRLAQGKMTVCTVGNVEGIRRLATLGWKRLNLSFSLNAANDALRDSLMPINRQWPLREVQSALIDFRQRPNFQVGINYCLMPGINDRRSDAAEVAEFCAPLGRAMVYLIPYNPGTHPITGVPDAAAVDRFITWLRAEGLPVRRRITKGRDVMAACGQLGNLRLRQTMRESSG